MHAALGCGLDPRRWSTAAPVSPKWEGQGGDGEKFVAGMRPTVITGTVGKAVERLRVLHEAGCHRMMAQHLLHRDTEAIELIGRDVAPLIERF